MNADFIGCFRMKENKINSQILWGIALLLMGLGVFIRIPQVMPNIEKMEQFKSVLPFIKFCLYFMGAFLSVAGIKKIYDQYFGEKP